MRAQDIVFKPLITEKALNKGDKQEYAFNVALHANKHQIAEAIEKLFSVEVATVKTLIRKGKTRRVGKRRQEKQLPEIKKAYVTLKKGTINIVPAS